MLRYDPNLKKNARLLRKNQTESETVLWSRLRRKQLDGVQFYRQKPIADYIVDFCAPSANLVVEVDGSQHVGDEHVQKDQERDERLAGQGLKVLRFDDRQVLVETEAVLQVILRTIMERRKG
jgi:very-short-patch-repair endonuclease